MPNIIYLATRSIHKQQEITQFLSQHGCTEFSVKLVTDLNPQINWEETGQSFVANARIKAQALAQFNTSDFILADDSGLCVDALHGAPGIFSSRFAGQEASDQENVNHLLENLKDTLRARRQAHFNCTLLLLTPSREEHVFVGECHGSITYTPQGHSGFGYDPVFFYPPLNRTFAEMTGAEKNTVSHRGQALEKLVKFLKSF